MNRAMQEAVLRRACARMTEALQMAVDLPAIDLFEARMAMYPVLGMVSRPRDVLLLEWREKKEGGRS